MTNLKEKETLTREYIFQAFYQLLKTNTYDSISVCDITEKAGVSRMSFYRNFKSKDDLAFKSIELVTSCVKKEVEQMESKNLYTISKVLFELLSQHKTVVKSFENTNLSKTLAALAIEKIKEIFPYDNINRTNKYLPLYYMGAISNVALEWLKNNCEESPEEMAKFISNLINDEP